MAYLDDKENIQAAFFKALADAGQEDLAARIIKDEPMSRHTTMRVGGPADLFAEPAGLLEAAALFHAAQKSKIPFFLLGNGSNLVVSDEGMDGLVVHFGDALSRIWMEEDPEHPGAVYVHAFAGALLSKTAMTCATAGFAGMEFAAGIPGSIGGAVFMNAGAYGGQMSDVVYQSVCLTEQGDMRTLTLDEHEFGYRQSYYHKNGGIVLSVVLHLFPGDKEAIMSRIRELNAKRSASQPLTLPSAGSVFKRPEGHFAGTLIQEAGLKGLKIGGACVSEKHAGFIVNAGGATAADILALVEKVREEVKTHAGVTLEPEILFVGRGFAHI